MTSKNEFKLINRKEKVLDINILIKYCCICKGELLNSCIIPNHNECPISIGKCYYMHLYHDCCIERWRRKKNCCPLDNKEWKIDRILT